MMEARPGSEVEGGMVLRGGVVWILLYDPFEMLSSLDDEGNIVNATSATV